MLRTHRTVLAKSPPYTYSVDERRELLFTRDEIGRVHQDAVDQGLPSEHLGELGDDLPFKPAFDLAIYERLEQQGYLQAFTVRDGDHLAGYAVFMTTHAPQVPAELRATQEFLFVRKQYRLGRLAIDFLRWVDEQLAQMGVTLVFHGVPTAARDFGPVLRRLGYSPFETVYARRLAWAQEQAAAAGTSSNIP